MKTIKTLSVAAVAALSLMSFGSFAAQSISAHGSTLDSAEANIAAQASRRCRQLQNHQRTR